MNTLEVNGVAHDIEVAGDETLLQTLRERLGLLGSKLGCGRGECGACTVMVGTRAVVACVTLTARVTESVTTIEGLEATAEDLRIAFAEGGAFQCGFCTPGQIVAAEAILRSGTPLDEASVRQGMSGNICRCTGYSQIVDAVLEVARERRRQP